MGMRGMGMRGMWKNVGRISFSLRGFHGQSLVSSMTSLRSKLRL